MSRLNNLYLFLNDEKGRTLPRAKLFFYENNSFDFKNTYADKALTSVNPNPVIADGAGRFPNIFLEADTYRVVLQDEDGVEISTKDDVDNLLSDGDLLGTSWISSLTTVSQMVAESRLSVGDRVRTSGYTTSGDGGSNDYEIVAGGTGTADGGSFIDLDNGLQAKGLFPGGVNVNQFGAKGVGTGFNDSPAVEACALYLISISGQRNTPEGFTGDSRPMVEFIPGKTYYCPDLISLDNTGKQIDWGTRGGSVVIFGNLKTNSFLDIQRLWVNNFNNIVFMGFNDAVTFDTNNVDTALVNFNNCDFIGNNRGVDTRSFAESRSCVLNFNECRAAYTDRLVDSYCDILSFTGGFYRNNSDNSAFILADSRVIVTGGGWVPFARGAGARWVDLYSSDTSGTRGFTSTGARWSKEGGGIPVIYNFIDGSRATPSTDSEGIMFFGGQAGSSDATTPEGVVVLTELAGASLAPSSIGFYGVDWSATNGLVVTESGSPVTGASKGNFVIHADEPTQYLLADSVTNPVTPLVEAQLEQFLTFFVYDFRVESQTGTYTLEAGKQKNIRFPSLAATATINGVSTNVMDGTEIKLTFRPSANAVTVQDAASGSNIQLAGGADFVATAWDTLVLQYDRAGATWVEVSRSLN